MTSQRRGCLCGGQIFKGQFGRETKIKFTAAGNQGDKYRINLTTRLVRKHYGNKKSTAGHEQHNKR
jgi:hypothetical protein